MIENRKLALTFIFITLFIDAMAISLIIPVMPDLMQHVGGGSLGNAAFWGGVMASIFAAMQFLFGPTIGSLSDRYGRRPILLISLLIASVDLLVMGLANTLWVLLAARIVGGIALATFPTASAYISDISAPEDKAANFGLVGAAFGMGFVLGPGIGGFLGEYDFRVPFFAAAAVAAANLVFGFFVLPETVTDKIRRPFEWRRANPLGALLEVRKLPNVGALLAIFLIYEFAFFVYPAVWPYFTILQFGWTEGLIGLSLTLFGISLAIYQGFLMRFILNFFGEKGTIISGFAFEIVVFTFFAFITNGLVVLIILPLLAYGSVVGPTLQGIMAKIASDDQQGELQGILNSVRSIATIFAPLVLTWIFFKTTQEGVTPNLPGSPFLVAAACVVVCLGVFMVVSRKLNTD